LFALGIRHTGEETAVLIEKNLKKVLGKSIKNLDDIIKIFPEITAEDWMKIKGIGGKSAESLVEWFSDKNNLELLEKIKFSGVEVVFPKLQNADQSLQGRTFVLTGEMKSFTRDEAKDIIRKKGGDVSSSVSRKTDYVVAGENPGSKYDKAKELGVKIISEEEFKRLIQ
jgi:DNA ligase (NAD+)